MGDVRLQCMNCGAPVGGPYSLCAPCSEIRLTHDLTRTSDAELVANELAANDPIINAVLSTCRNQGMEWPSIVTHLIRAQHMHSALLKKQLEDVCKLSAFPRTIVISNTDES